MESFGSPFFFVVVGEGAFQRWRFFFKITLFRGKWWGGYHSLFVFRHTIVIFKILDTVKITITSHCFLGTVRGLPNVS